MPPRPSHARAVRRALGFGVLAAVIGSGAALAAAEPPSQTATGPVDRWAHEYSSAEYAARLADLNGSASRVGLRLRIERDALVIAGVDQGGPADRAGVRAGERVLAVGGRPVTASDLSHVVRELRDGGADTTVAGPTGTRDVDLDASASPLSAVSVRDMSGGLRLVRVDSIVRDAAENVARLLTQSEGSMTGVVLDLRGNGGGLVTEAVDLAGVFIEGGPGVTYPRADGSVRALDTPRSGGEVTAPMVVLVDGATASAAEIVAGILQDRGRAVVVGTPTFGKGTVQAPSLSASGTVQERTLGRYLLPSGRGVDEQGIAPDVFVSHEVSEAARMSVATSVLSGLAPTDQARG